MTQLPQLTSVRLRARSLDALANFYEEVIGLHRQPSPSGEVRLGASTDAGFPLVVLEEDTEAVERPSSAAGLFHLAILLPSRRALSQALRRLQAASYRLTGASDHLVSHALYLDDPEGNGIEIYWDQPQQKWPIGANGQVLMDTLPLDLGALLAESDATPAHVPHDTVLGHVHLEVSDLDRTTQFGLEVLGLNIRLDYGRAHFMAWGDYHHHIAANSWRRRNQPMLPNAKGLVAIRVDFPSAAAIDDVVARAQADDGLTVERGEDLVTLIGPDGIRWELGLR